MSAGALRAPAPLAAVARHYVALAAGRGTLQDRAARCAAHVAFSLLLAEAVGTAGPLMAVQWTIVLAASLPKRHWGRAGRTAIDGSLPVNHGSHALLQGLCGAALAVAEVAPAAALALAGAWLLEPDAAAALPAWFPAAAVLSIALTYLLAMAFHLRGGRGGSTLAAMLVLYLFADLRLHGLPWNETIAGLLPALAPGVHPGAWAVSAAGWTAAALGLLALTGRFVPPPPGISLLPRRRRGSTAPPRVVSSTTGARIPRLGRVAARELWLLVRSTHGIPAACAGLGVLAATVSGAVASFPPSSWVGIGAIVAAAVLAMGVTGWYGRQEALDDALPVEPASRHLLTVGAGLAGVAAATVLALLGAFAGAAAAGRIPFLLETPPAEWARAVVVPALAYLLIVLFLGVPRSRPFLRGWWVWALVVVAVFRAWPASTMQSWVPGSQRVDLAVPSQESLLHLLLVGTAVVATALENARIVRIHGRREREL